MKRWPTVAGIVYPLFIACAAGAHVYFQTRVVTSRVPSDWRDQSAGTGALALIVVAVVAGLIIARRPRNRIGWVLVLATFTAWFSFAFAPDYGAYGLYMAPGSLPAPLLPQVIGGMTFGLFFSALIVVLPLIYPDGRLLSRRWSWVLVLAGVGVLIAIPAPFDPTTFSNDHLANPYGIAAVTGYQNGVLHAIGALLAMLSGLLATASVVVRYRRSGSDVRHQIKWFAAAVTLLAVVFAFQTITLQQSGPLLPITVAAVGVAIAIAVLRYRLYDIDVVISRALVYGALAAFITAVYVGIVVGVGTVVGSGGKPNLALSIVATAIVAVAFQPVRERLQKIANRLVYGKRATPYEVLSEFSERVAETYAADEALPRMAKVLAEGTGAEIAQVWLRNGSMLRAVATWPEGARGSTNGTADATLAVTGQLLPQIPDADRAVPVRHQGELLGALTVNKRSGETLTPIEENLLDDLANQAGLVLKNVGLTAELLQRLEELRASRQRLVAAQDEERRRLERNLHDGAQQNLVALKVKLGLAEAFAEKDPGRARALLGEVKAETDEALETLRDLARGIYPPLLADKGLPAALEAQARKATVPVTVDANGVGRFPQDVEAAVYFCVLEALQNVQKYAQASGAVVSLTTKNGELLFEIADDGKGFDPDVAKRGSGLTNMSDRMDALGGTVALESAPGDGTKVRGRLPISEAVTV